MVSWLLGWLVCWLAGWLVAWLVGSSVSRSVGRLVAWLAGWSVGSYFNCLDEVQLDVAHRQPRAVAVEVGPPDLLEAHDVGVEEQGVAHILHQPIKKLTDQPSNHPDRPSNPTNQLTHILHDERDVVHLVDEVAEAATLIAMAPVQALITEGLVGWLVGWLVWFGLVWFGLVWFGLVGWFGLVYVCLVSLVWFGRLVGAGDRRRGPSPESPPGRRSCPAGTSTPRPLRPRRRRGGAP